MNSLDISKSPLGVSTEAIGFFLAGIFSLNTSINNWQITDYVLLIVGSFLSLYGIILLLNIIFPKLDFITGTFKFYFVIIVFSIGGAQLAIIIATYTILFQIMAVIFLLLFIFAIVYTSISVFQDKKKLFTIFITMLIIGLIQFFLVNNRLSWDRWDLYFILALEIIFISLFIKQTRKSKNTTISQQKTD